LYDWWIFDEGERLDFPHGNFIAVRPDSLSIGKSTTTSMPISTDSVTLSSTFQPSSASATTTSAINSPTCSTIAPSGAQCFTVNGHGAPHIEGLKLAVHESIPSPAFGNTEGFSTAIFYVDANGYMHIASSVNADWIMARQTTDPGPPGFIEFYPLYQFDNPSYPAKIETICDVDSANSALVCNQSGEETNSVETQYDPNDIRTNMPLFGVNGHSTVITLTRDVVDCPCE
jgi:hypothetical protein